MSINVTVNGNPCNISKKSCKKHRKQKSSPKSKGEDKLKVWQARKLLQIHNQYQEALKDLGLGHKSPETENEQTNSSLKRNNNLGKSESARQEKSKEDNTIHLCKCKNINDCNEVHKLFENLGTYSESDIQENGRKQDNSLHLCKCHCKNMKDGNKARKQSDWDNLAGPDIQKKERNQNNEILVPKLNIQSKENHSKRSEKRKPKEVDRYDNSNKFSTKNASSYIQTKEHFTVTRRINADMETQRRNAEERERIRQDHSKLMKKLPILQRQERICEINSNKTKYHLSKERQEEVEQKKENKLNNAYEKLFTKTKSPIITSNKSKRNNTPISFEEANAGSSENGYHTEWSKCSASSNVNDFNGTKKQESKNVEREEKEELKMLIDNLNAQKRKLVKEIVDMGDTYDFFPKKKISKPKAPEKLNFSNGNNNKNVTKLSSWQKTYVDQTTKILQDMSTQTKKKNLPTTNNATVLASNEKHDEIICNKKHVPCNCLENINSDSWDNLLQVIIKINNEKPDVFMGTSNEGKDKNLLFSNIPTNSSKKDDNKLASKINGSNARNKTDDNGLASWCEYFSQNSPLISTGKSFLHTSNFENLQEKLCSTLINTNVINATQTSNNQQNLDPTIVNYIKQLLTMSRGNITNLLVSSESEISTPSQSIIEIESNNILHQLEQLVRYVNLNLHDTVQNCTKLDSNKSKSDNYSVLVNHYNDVMSQCINNISKLSERIEEVRKEKTDIVENSTSNSGSGEYFDVSAEISDTNSPFIKSIGQKLLAHLMRTNLENTNNTTLVSNEDKNCSSVLNHISNSMDDDLLQRFRCLMTINESQCESNDIQNKEDKEDCTCYLRALNFDSDNDR